MPRRDWFTNFSKEIGMNTDIILGAIIGLVTAVIIHVMAKALYNHVDKRAARKKELEDFVRRP